MFFFTYSLNVVLDFVFWPLFVNNWTIVCVCILRSKERRKYSYHQYTYDMYDTAVSIIIRNYSSARRCGLMRQWNILYYIVSSCTLLVHIVRSDVKLMKKNNFYFLNLLLFFFFFCLGNSTVIDRFIGTDTVNLSVRRFADTFPTKS